MSNTTVVAGRFVNIPTRKKSYTDTIRIGNPFYHATLNDDFLQLPRRDPWKVFVKQVKRFHPKVK